MALEDLQLTTCVTNMRDELEDQELYDAWISSNVDGMMKAWDRMLEPWNGKTVKCDPTLGGNRIFTFEFNSEKDKLLFILRWS